MYVPYSDAMYRRILPLSYLQLLVTCMLQPRLSSPNAINMFQTASVEARTDQYMLSSHPPCRLPPTRSKCPFIFHYSPYPASKLSEKFSVTFLRLRPKSDDPALLHLLSERVHTCEWKSLSETVTSAIGETHAALPNHRQPILSAPRIMH